MNLALAPLISIPKLSLNAAGSPYQIQAKTQLEAHAHKHVKHRNRTKPSDLNLRTATEFVRIGEYTYRKTDYQSPHNQPTASAPLHWLKGAAEVIFVSGRPLHCTSNPKTHPETSQNPDASDSLYLNACARPELLNTTDMKFPAQ